MVARVRQKYWSLVHKGAWELSKKNFQWISPLVFGALVFLVTWFVAGFEEAVKNLRPRGFIGAATILFAVLAYVYNLFRSAADVYVEQLNAIGKIEQQSQNQISALERRIEELNSVPDPLRIVFEAGVPPFEESQTVSIGIPLGGMREGVVWPIDRTTQIIRVRVDNVSASDVQNVSVRLSFEPERRRLSNLLLHVMHDNPDEGLPYQRSFLLPAFDHQFVDVLTYHSGNETAKISHIISGIENELSHGEHTVVITARGSNIRPSAEHFTVAITPERAVFRTRESVA